MMTKKVGEKEKSGHHEKADDQKREAKRKNAHHKKVDNISIVFPFDTLL